MKEIKFPPLRKDQIELRVGTFDESKGATLLIYKDARTDADMLDEYVGQFNWQRRHYVLKDVIYCEVSVWDAEKGQWISKSDCGKESNTEAEKGESSDAFKRACFQWGIGRKELYNSPFIWIGRDKIAEYRLTKYTRYTIKEYECNSDHIITKLVITDDKRNVVYTYGASAPRTATAPVKTEQPSLPHPHLSVSMLDKAIEYKISLPKYAQHIGKNENELTDTDVQEAINLKVKLLKEKEERRNG